MINVAIAGAAAPQAGELIRLLINHPDVNLVSLDDDMSIGTSVAKLHHGLIGETELTISPYAVDNKDINILFILKEDAPISKYFDLYPELKTIDLAGQTDVRLYLTYGLPELNRKPLVRGALHSIVPSSAEVIIGLLLLPVVMSGQLEKMAGEELRIHLTADQDIISSFNSEMINRLRQNLNINVPIILSTEAVQSPNFISASIDVSGNAASKDSLLNLYREFYDDHNLTHIVYHKTEPKEVKNTDKAIISILQVENSSDVRLTAIADPQLRGAAGDAIHIMNLLFGLFEKTGLTLKASTH